MFSYGYLLASLLSYRISHVRNACARLLVYLRDISHYQGEPSVDHREEGRAREGKRNGAFIFSFYPTNVLAHIDVYTHTHTHTHTHTRARARARALDPDWGLKYTREFTFVYVRVDRNSSVGPRNCRQPDAALPTTSGSRIRSCKHLPFAQSAFEVNAPRSVVKTVVFVSKNALSNEKYFSNKIY